MAETSASPVTTAASVPPTGVTTGARVAGSSGPTNPQSPKSAVTDQVEADGEGSVPAADAGDDEEYEVDGAKVRRKELFDTFKRQKDFERASHKRMQEASQLRKERAAEDEKYERAFKELENDPYAIHRARGYSDERIDEIAESRLMQRMQRAQMSPEQIEAEQIRSERDKYKTDLEKFQEQQKQSRQKQLTQHYREHFDQQIAKAMEIGNLARTASTGAKVAQVMSEYLSAGEQIEPALAAQIVRDNYQTEVRHEFTELRGQLAAGRITQDKFLTYITDLVGPETIKAIRQSGIKEAQNFEPQKPRPKAPMAPPKKQFDSFEEADKWIKAQRK